MKIKVTKKHIEDGDKSSFVSCPVALALIEKNCLNVHVSTRSCTFTKENKLYVNKILSKKAQEFIKKFDMGFPVKPFEFTLKGVK